MSKRIRSDTTGALIDHRVRAGTNFVTRAARILGSSDSHGEALRMLEAYPVGREHAIKLHSFGIDGTLIPREDISDAPLAPQT